jgi:hypothetical protein
LVVNGRINGPPVSMALQDEGVVDGEIRAEGRFIAAAATGVSDQHDVDRVVAQRTVPEGGAAEGSGVTWRPERGTDSESRRRRVAAIALGVGRQWPRLRGRPP